MLERHHFITFNTNSIRPRGIAALFRLYRLLEVFLSYQQVDILDQHQHRHQHHSSCHNSDPLRYTTISPRILHRISSNTDPKCKVTKFSKCRMDNNSTSLNSSLYSRSTWLLTCSLIRSRSLSPVLPPPQMCLRHQSHQIPRRNTYCKHFPQLWLSKHSSR